MEKLQLPTCKLPSETILKSRLGQAKLTSFIDECPRMLIHANQCLAYISLDYFITDSLLTFSETRNASHEAKEEYNAKIAGVFLQDDPDALKVYQELHAVKRFGYTSKLNPAFNSIQSDEGYEVSSDSGNSLSIV